MDDESYWELTPQNAHPTARSLMTQDFYWQCSDENSPFGNDTGADLLAFFRAAWRENAVMPGLGFLADLLACWHVADRDWDVIDADEVSRFIHEDRFSFIQREDSILALAFAQLLCAGRVDSDIRERALLSLNRQKTEAALTLWPTEIHDERRVRLDLMQNALNAAP